ncbi:MAG: co-chaperone HscB [Gammaproteobacteria bacterium]|nr:MAG: co-chaperone HscB [Gammaproteobacteria bacterium]
MLEKNFFELFGIPETFDIDSKDLKRRYQDLQRQFHPDKFANASDQERRMSMQITAQINEALQTLLNPVQRGRYLLKLSGVDINDDHDTTMDPAFLMEQIELREKLENINKQADPQKEFMDFMGNVENCKQKCRNQLSKLFLEKSDSANSRARNVLRELQFFDKISSEIEELEERLL